MADEESPAQRQARIRREKREAKIKAGGSERLDKITKLSGRTPESMRREESDSPAPTREKPSTPAPPKPPPSDPADPAAVQAQQEYLRAMLRASNENEHQSDQPEDPMMKMLESMLGSMGAGQNGEPPGMSFSPDDISKATGLPPFLLNTFMGGKKATPAQEKTARMWNAIHLVFAVIAGVYVLFVLNRSLTLFGPNPPAPATMQNPFLVFIMGELLIEGTKIATSDRAPAGGLGSWFQILTDVLRDGGVVVFIMGAASYWKGLT